MRYVTLARFALFAFAREFAALAPAGLFEVGLAAYERRELIRLIT